MCLGMCMYVCVCVCDESDVCCVAWWRAMEREAKSRALKPKMAFRGGCCLGF